MVGPTLIEIREYIEALATADGTYYVVCGRTGDRPVPAAGNRFPDRATARAAARATAQYRSALRRYDPRVPYYDLIVCAETARETRTARAEEPTADTPQRRLSEPVVTDSNTPERRNLVEFCHRMAGAVFETLSEAGYDAVERAVMDAYFELGERVGDPDELCLCLLESMATELDDRLAPVDQLEILAGAAARLEPPTADAAPIEATLSTLGQQGLIGGYTHSSAPSDLDDGAGTVVVQVRGYALSSRDGRLPVLPLTLELCRHYSDRLPLSVRVTAVDGGWQLSFDLAETVESTGLVSAPIDGGV